MGNFDPERLAKLAKLYERGIASRSEFWFPLFEGLSDASDADAVAFLNGLPAECQEFLLEQYSGSANDLFCFPEDSEFPAAKKVVQDWCEGQLSGN